MRDDAVELATRRVLEVEALAALFQEPDAVSASPAALAAAQAVIDAHDAGDEATAAAALHDLTPCKLSLIHI